MTFQKKRAPSHSWKKASPRTIIHPHAFSYALVWICPWTSTWTPNGYVLLKAHAAELRAWASDAGVRLPSAESAGELREQVRDLPQEPQIQEQPGYGYQPGFQQPQQWQQQPWN